MEIAFLSSWHRGIARGTGTAAAIAGLGGGLESLGHGVHMILPERGTPGGTAGRIAYNLTVAPRLLGERFDLVVGFDLDGCFVPSTLRSRLVVSLKGIAADERRFDRGLPRLVLRVLAALEGWSARRAPRVVVTSEYCRGVAAAAYRLDPERIRVVPEGIDLRAWERPSDASPPGGRGPIVLDVARHYPRKDTGTLIEAFAAVRSRHPEAGLRVVGGGPELPRLRALVAALGPGCGVELLGEIADDAAVRREYFGADVFCLPSRQEGFGIAFLEAMAAGLPIVAARATAVPEVVADGETGLLVPPGDREALAAAICRLIEDGGLRRRLGEAGRRRVRDYGWPQVARAFLGALPAGWAGAARGRG